MANIIKTKQDPNQTQANADIAKVDFGAKAAIAAATTAKQSKQQKKQDKKQQQQKPQDKTLVEQREDETRQIIGLSGGSITGAQQKSNKQMQQAATAEAVDAWTDPTKVRDEDDLDAALEKRMQRAETDLESQISTTDDPVIVTLEEVDGLNAVGSTVRDYGNFGVIEMSPELYLVLGGYSESFDNLLASKGMEVLDPSTLSADEVQNIFNLLQTKKRKALNEEEKEAELILAGAVSILAIPKILEKLDELGLDPEQALSLKGTLSQLLEEVEQEDSEYHSMYLLIKEETEYSKLPEDDGAGAPA